MALCLGCCRTSPQVPCEKLLFHSKVPSQRVHSKIAVMGEFWQDPTPAGSKLTIKTPEQSVKYVQYVKHVTLNIFNSLF